MSLAIISDPTERPKAPNIFDYAELIAKYLPEPYVKLADLAQLERRCNEINLEMPRFQEETPIVLRNERKRRAAFTMQAR